MPLQVGQQAPDFTLKSNKMQDVKLSEQRGSKVLLLFVPLAFTGVCTKELCGMRDSLKEYEGLDCKVFGLSTDSPFALDAWAKEQSYQFPLLSDYNKETAREYGALYEDLMGLKGVCKRSAFVVDRQGVVRYAEVLADARNLPNFDAIKGCLKQLA
ncbi:MAG: redoxin domain-containing protein [Deltaproteobacteria bacterium]|nr:redoxin domain-containing protein [Deltaproteobacteria bacterium]MBV8451635.1 redoxin domain-containing protein [Deltaproteobacteria bacterium]